MYKLKSSESNSLALLNHSSDLSSYHTMKKKRTRWDDNKKPYIKNLSRRTRWGTEFEKTFTPLPMVTLPDGITSEEIEILLRKQRLDDISKRMACNDWENADPDLRSPSPEPVYDSKTGQRVNTRELRTKEKYNKEKYSIIEELLKLDPTYKPPLDYRPPKKTKKLFIPEIEGVNFAGLILGRGGAAQKELENKSGCKISIRGNGSNWNNQNKTYDKQTETDESLHVFIQADSEEKLMAGIRLIEPLLDVNSAEFQEHRNAQKNQMMVTYGYTKDSGCENCGEKGHRTWACPVAMSVARANVKCGICGDKSHPTVDCPEKPEKAEVNPSTAEIENAYSKLMREIKSDSAGVPMLDSDTTPDIRNSVLWTGKIPEAAKKSSDQPNLEDEEDGEEDVRIDDLVEPKNSDVKDRHLEEEIEKNMQYERELYDYEKAKNKESVEESKVNSSNFGPYQNQPQLHPQPNNNYQQVRPTQYPQPQQKPNIMGQPLINANVKTVAPVNNFAGNIQQQNTLGNYYNTFLNPYAYQNPAFSSIGGYNSGIKNPMNYAFNKKYHYSLENQQYNQRMSMIAANPINSQNINAILNNIPQRMTSQGVFFNSMNFVNPNNPNSIRYPGQPNPQGMGSGPQGNPGAPGGLQGNPGNQMNQGVPQSNQPAQINNPKSPGYTLVRPPSSANTDVRPPPPNPDNKLPKNPPLPPEPPMPKPPQEEQKK